MKTWKHCTFIGILAVSFLVFAFGCNGGKSNSLSGTWEASSNNEYAATIAFSGKNFTITEYPLYYDGNYWFNTGVRPDFILGNVNESTYAGSWQNGLDFYREVAKGTYSISDNKIELSFSKSGNVNVYPFSCTENTITIKGKQFTRMR